MSLYQPTVLKEYLAKQDKPIIEKAYKKYKKYFQDPEIQRNIRASKEEQFQAKFLDELFSNIFGYTLHPKPNANLITEFKNEKNSRKADGAILKDGKAVAVIELKGTKTKDLESISTQAFGYKANQADCVYVITSNFEKLRFYIHDATNHIEFNLFTLDLEQFSLLFLCLNAENLLNNLPQTIKKASIAQEEKITKTFYTDYSLFKRELFRDLVKNNIKNEIFRAEIQKEDTDRASKNIKRALFKKSQKLIDRFLFIFFAEDCQLLPANSTLQILNKWKNDVEFGDDRPLYEIFKIYFKVLDQGRKGTEHQAEIFAYNGGLFKPDNILNSLIIDNELLYKHTKKLSDYDFSSQLDVNILGHIFENSLNEIESINAEIEERDFDKQKTKRKKDGVFYTPKYITKYVIDNTVGKLCEDKRKALEIYNEDFSPSRQMATKKNLLAGLESYREWLLKITILDPACGSGAFLNQALDFLIQQHRKIDEETTQLTGGSIVFPNIENTILEQNIYGVDLNEESVEIAKLSLWLRTAQPRRKLTSLNNNIKCGNSLIDDSKFAGDKAFCWKNEFSEVFKEGGFDIVIGNPPYVRQELIKPYKEYLETRYKTYQSTADLYVYFIELSVDLLLKENGIYSIIVANKWMRSNYGYELRKYLKQQNIVEIIDFGDLPVFQDATAYPCILTIKRSEPSQKFKGTIIDTLSFPSLESYTKIKSINVNQNLLDDSAWSIVDEKISTLLNRLKNSYEPLKSFIDEKMFVGLKTGLNEAFIITKNEYDSFIKSDIKYIDIIQPYVVGRDISRYGIPTVSKYIICIPSKWTNSQGKFNNEDEAWCWFEQKYKKLAAHLLPYETKAKKRTDKGEYWWELRACEYYSEFQKEKIIYSEIATEGRFTIDKCNLYCDMTAFMIGSSSHYLLSILNSKLFTFLFKHTSSEIRGGFLRWKRQYMYPLPIPEIRNEEHFITLTTELAKSVSKKNTTTHKVQQYILSQFQTEKLPKKLNNWQEIDFSIFIKELNKVSKKASGTKLTKSDEMEWMELFEEKKSEVLSIQEEINKNDKEIDQMVYELYGLTEDEIKIVEGI